MFKINKERVGITRDNEWLYIVSFNDRDNNRLIESPCKDITYFVERSNGVLEQVPMKEYIQYSFYY